MDTSDTDDTAERLLQVAYGSMEFLRALESIHPAHARVRELRKVTATQCSILLTGRDGEMKSIPTQQVEDAFVEEGLEDRHNIYFYGADAQESGQRTLMTETLRCLNSRTKKPALFKAHVADALCTRVTAPRSEHASCVYELLQFDTRTMATASHHFFEALERRIHAVRETFKLPGGEITRDAHEEGFLLQNFNELQTILALFYSGAHSQSFGDTEEVAETHGSSPMEAYANGLLNSLYKIGENDLFDQFFSIVSRQLKNFGFSNGNWGHWPGPLRNTTINIIALPDGTYTLDMYRSRQPELGLDLGKKFGRSTGLTKTYVGMALPVERGMCHIDCAWLEEKLRSVLPELHTTTDQIADAFIETHNKQRRRESYPDSILTVHEGDAYNVSIAADGLHTPTGDSFRCAPWQRESTTVLAPVGAPYWRPFELQSPHILFKVQSNRYVPRLEPYFGSEHIPVFNEESKAQMRALTDRIEQALRSE